MFSEYESNLCVIILPWVKYHYKIEPMGASKSPDSLREKIYALFQHFKCINVYIDGLLV